MTSTARTRATIRAIAGLIATVWIVLAQGRSPAQGDEPTRRIHQAEDAASVPPGVPTTPARGDSPAVPALIESLRSPTSSVRIDAATRLAEIKPLDLRVLPALIEATGRMQQEPGADEQESYEEIVALAHAIRSQGPDAVKPIVAALDHEKAAVRAVAVQALAMLTAPSEPSDQRKPVALGASVVRRLITLVDDPFELTRITSLTTLMTVGPESDLADLLIGTFVKKLDDRSDLIRCLAARSLVAFGPRSKPALGPLMDWFARKKSSPGAAAELLGALGAEAAPAVPLLSEIARGPDPEYRAHAIDALGGIGPNVPGVLPAIRAAMTDADDRVRAASATALGRMGERELSRLIESLASRDIKERKTAVEAIGQLRSNAAPALPALIRAMADPHEGIALRACLALAEMREAAVPRVIEALKHTDARVRLGASEVLGRIGGPAVSARELLATLRDGDPDPGVRRFASVASAVFRPEDAANRAALADALRDEDEESEKRLRDVAVVVLGHLAASRKPDAVTGLLEILSRLVGPTGEANSGASFFIEASLEAVTPEMLPVLLPGLERKELRQPLARVVAKKLDATTVPNMIAMLRSDIPARRAGAAAAFASLATLESGRKLAASAVPVLTDALKDADAAVRAEAATALQFIGTGDAEATKLLVRQMGDADSVAADRAGLALARGFRADPEVAVPGLIAKLAVPREADREFVSDALGKVGAPAIPELVRLLTIGETSSRRVAARAIGVFVTKGPVGDATARDLAVALANALADPDALVRDESSYALRCLREKARPVVPILLGLLDHKRTATRVAAIGSLSQFAATESAGLVRHLNDRDPEIRVASAVALAGEPIDGIPGEEVIAPLLLALKDPEARVRAAVATSLRFLFEGLARRAAMLSEFPLELAGPQEFPGELVHRAGGVASLAAPALVGFHAIRMFLFTRADEAFERVRPQIRDGLLVVLGDRDADVRLNAVVGLRAVAGGDEKALTPLLERLSDEEARVRAEASDAVSVFSAAAVPGLIQRLAKRDEPRTRAAAARALASVDPATAIRPALDLLATATEDSDQEVRAQASLAFATVADRDPESFRTHAPRIVVTLLKDLTHRDVAPRRASSRALAWTGPAADRDRDVLPALIASLEDPDAEVRKNSAVALRALDDRALAAVPALHRACKDPDREVRQMARNAIDVIHH